MNPADIKAPQEETSCSQPRARGSIEAWRPPPPRRWRPEYISGSCSRARCDPEFGSWPVLSVHDTCTRLSLTRWSPIGPNGVSESQRVIQNRADGGILRDRGQFEDGRRATRVVPEREVGEGAAHVDADHSHRASLRVR